MIENNNGIFEVYCDASMCESYEAYDTDNDWQEMISDMKSDGWLIIKEKGDWTHICPDCADEYKEEKGWS